MGCGTVPPVSSSLSPTDSVHRWSEFLLCQASPRTLDPGNTRLRLRMACLDSGHNARLGRAARTTARRRWDRARERRTLSRKPAHVAERQLEAVPDEPEEQHADVLQVIPNRFWI